LSRYETESFGWILSLRWKLANRTRCR
jgi:hypothetical protein